MPDTTGTDAPRRRSDTPTRPAEHNRSAVAGAPDQHVDGLLPSLNPGVTLVDIEADRNVPIVHAMVCDHLLGADGPAFWVDAQGYATTATLAQIAPSRRLLNRIHVARGFTAYQHFSALADLPEAVNAHVKAATTTDAFRQRDANRTDDEDPHPEPGLIVAPAVDALYRADDTLGDAQTRRLLARSLARLRQYADAYDVPVLCTRTKQDTLTESIEAAATHQYRCETTRMGPRITGEDFEPQWYPVAGGSAYQTTLAYWADLLAARADQAGVQPDTPSPSLDADMDDQITTAPAHQTGPSLLETWAGQPGRGR